VPPRTPTSE